MKTLTLFVLFALTACSHKENFKVSKTLNALTATYNKTSSVEVILQAKELSSNLTATCAYLPRLNKILNQKFVVLTVDSKKWSQLSEENQKLMLTHELDSCSSRSQGFKNSANIKAEITLINLFSL